MVVDVKHLRKSERDIFGYEYVTQQNSREDQWQKLIEPPHSLLRTIWWISPINKEDILRVIISRNGKEKNRIINFNISGY